MKRKPIYGIGDKVKIVNYGHPIWENKKMRQPKLSFPLISENEDIRWLDMSPDLIEQEGIVEKVSMTQGMPHYAIDGIKGKHSWYDEGQMEMVNKNPNREQNDSIIDLQKEVDKLKKELQAEREINVGHRNQNNVISNWLVDYKKEVDELKEKEEKHISLTVKFPTESIEIKEISEGTESIKIIKLKWD